MHTNTVVFGEAQQAIHNLKTWIAVGPVYASDFHELLIFAIITQSDHAFNQGIAVNVHGDFVIGFFNRNQMLTERF
jgi:hypothetical protein